MPEPVLPYSDDSARLAELRTIVLFHRWLLIVSAIYYLAFASYGVMFFLVLYLNIDPYPLPIVIIWLLSPVLMVLIALLTWKLQNLFTGIVLALLIVIPCAGSLIPVVVLMNGYQHLRQAGLEVGVLGARVPTTLIKIGGKLLGLARHMRTVLGKEAVMNLERTVTLPQLGLIAATRGMAGAGLGLLLGEKLSTEKRKAVGWTLLAVGVLTTFPLLAMVLGGKKSAPSESGRSKFREYSS